MTDLDPRMLPPKEPDVTPEPSPAPEQAPVTMEAVTPPAAPGSKTPPENLLEALKEERRQRQALAQELELLKTSAPSTAQPEVFSDEGLALQNQIKALEKTILTEREEGKLERLRSQNPALRDKSDEFDEFRKEYQGIPIEKVARLFLSEKGLLSSPERKGLESPIGGDKTPSPGLSEADVKRMRENNPRKYLKALQEGKINPADIR